MEFQTEQTGSYEVVADDNSKEKNIFSLHIKNTKIEMKSLKINNNKAEENQEIAAVEAMQPYATETCNNKKILLNYIALKNNILEGSINEHECEFIAVGDFTMAKYDGSANIDSVKKLLKAAKKIAPKN